METSVAVLVAAGSGSRFASSMPKQFLPLLGKPMLAHTLARFDASGVVSRSVVVLPREGFETWRDRLLPHLPGEDEATVAFVPGGATRQDSVEEGLRALGKPAELDLVLVHDGARPAVPSSLIVDVVRAAERDGAAIAALPVVETLKEVSEDLFVTRTVDRQRFFRAQTPQCFRYGILRRAMDRALASGFQGTDEAALVERIGAPIRIVPGSERNLKVTTAEDLERAEYYLRKGEL